MLTDKLDEKMMARRARAPRSQGMGMGPREAMKARRASAPGTGFAFAGATSWSLAQAGGGDDAPCGKSGAGMMLSICHWSAWSVDGCKDSLAGCTRLPEAPCAGFPCRSQRCRARAGDQNPRASSRA